MRIPAIVSAITIALSATIGLAANADQLATMDRVTAVPMAAADQFTTMKGVKATPMASSELDTVKGMHIHFLDANGGFHLAGNPDNNGIGEGNWYLNGSPDGQPVHPSYHGLCPAGAITIPTGGLSQCP